MSHGYPFSRPLPDSNFKRNQQTGNSSAESGFYGERQGSFSSYTSSSPGFHDPFSASMTSDSPQPTQGSQENASNILMRCGLKHEDLVRLSKLPDDVLNLKSLPHILQQVHGDNEAAQHFPPSSSSYSNSAYQPSTNFSSRELDQLSTMPVQYPLMSTTSSCEPVLDRWGNPISFSSGQSEPSSQSRHMEEFNRSNPDYGKTGPLPFFSSAGPASRALEPLHPYPGPPDHRAASAVPLPPPPPSYREPLPNLWDTHCEPAPCSSSFRSRHSSDSAPSRKQARDFHGMSPQVFPYSCSLCDICVLSNRAWIQHVASAVHTDSQLLLLQQYPSWNCRVEEPRSRNDNQPDRWKNRERPIPPTGRARHDQASSGRGPQKASEKGKVVCVKFPAQSVDEAFLRNLVEPFGNLVQIIMFPTLAFLEMGTIEQANDLVKYHIQNPQMVNDEQIEFSISDTFKFIQSSQVVSFSPPPYNLDGRSDLLSIIKRFGVPDYTLFLPSKAFVEMKTTEDAQKLVDYYRTNTLWINKDRISVAFSTEYKTLMRVHSAKTYEEELKAIQKNKESRNRSREMSRRRKRSRSKDQSTDTKDPKRKNRSRSRERSNRDQGSRTRHSSRDISSRERSTRTRDESSKTQSSPKQEDEKKPDTEVTGTEAAGTETAGTEAAGTEATEGETSGKSQTGDKESEAAGEDPERNGDSLSAEESVIEGMEVIAEDGKKIKDEAEGEEVTDEITKQKQEDEVKTTDDQEVSGLESDAMEQEKNPEENEEEAGCPLDLDNCITLDEVESDDEVKVKRARQRSESPNEVSRVLFFSSMPTRFSDKQLLKLMRSFGTVVRYLLIRGRRQGFVEMSTSSEAIKVAKHLDSKYISIGGCRLYGSLSRKYTRLTNGWDVKPNKDKNTTGSEKASSPDGKNSPRKSKRRESSRRSKSEKSPEKNSSSKKDDKQLSKNSESQKDSHQKRTKSPERKKRASDTAEKTKTEPEEKKTEEPLKSEKAEEKDFSADVHQEEEIQEAPAEETREPEKPVGAEFVRPVVGYFCNLCEVIFCDEDEAKSKHCRTLEHCRKYQEKTGEDPWNI